MRQLFLLLLVTVCLSSVSYAQKDTVNVMGYYESGNVDGTLNDAIQAAVTAGTINNTVFKLTPYEVYVLSRSIFMDTGQNLEIVAPKPGTTQETAPPQIVWTEQEIDRQYLIQTYANLVLKNVWVRFDDFLGVQRGTSIAFEDSLAVMDKEYGYFEGVIFDYAGIGSEGSGAISVKADGFSATFQNCYFRNYADDHFQYYGRVVSFPYQSSGFHVDTLRFENCTLTNSGRLIMQEGNEYCDNVFINHCTLLNTVEWVYQSAGWIRNTSITNSIFVNSRFFGYRATDVCDSDQDYNAFLNGECDPVGAGGLIGGITAADSFGFAVDFTDYDRKIFIGNNVYMTQPWLVDWYKQCDWCQDQIKNRMGQNTYNPFPMLGTTEMTFIDSTDGQGNKVFPSINLDSLTIYDEDPGFMVEATNYDSLKLFIQGRWGTGLDIVWAYHVSDMVNQKWPLTENLAYSNTTYMTAAMGGFPLGDLNWYPDQLPAWAAQRDAEWTAINSLLLCGSPNPDDCMVHVREDGGRKPSNYVLGQNYPNPFNPTTNIKYSVPTSGYVSLKVFNNLGQEVATLFDGDQQAGNYIATFDGSGLASGVYLYRLQSGNVSIAKKLLLMK